MKPPFSFLLLILELVPGLAHAEGLRAAAAKCDITPPVGHPMWGYSARHDAPCQGVMDPLHARVLVLEADGKRLALISLDLGRALTRDSMARFRRLIEPQRIEALFVVGSHTHHGPVLEVEDWPTPDKPYVRELEAKLARSMEQAVASLRPAKIGLTTKEVLLNRNRHSKLADRPVDRELTVLRVEDKNGQPMAHAVNFAAHPTMRDAKDLRFSADFPGVMAQLVEQKTGVPCLFLQGAAGDLSPNPLADAKGADAFGRQLGEQVLTLIERIRCDTPSRSSLDYRSQEFRFASTVDLSSPLVKLALGRAFFPQLIQFYQREYQQGVRPSVSVALLNQNLAIVGVSGEVFCGHALSFKRRARMEHVLFLGYCNDYHQYFPTIEALAEGGYGTQPPVSLAEPGAGERMIDQALLMLYRMRGKIVDQPAPMP